MADGRQSVLYEWSDVTAISSFIIIQSAYQMTSLHVSKLVQTSTPSRQFKDILMDSTRRWWCIVVVTRVHCSHSHLIWLHMLMSNVNMSCYAGLPCFMHAKSLIVLFMRALRIRIHVKNEIEYWCVEGAPSTCSHRSFTLIQVQFLNLRAAAFTGILIERPSAPQSAYTHEHLHVREQY